ncbi:hypothetical protein KVR01_005376 [Diaporthe batatas]|uniref:uncharacterized protein n=1 Tax=Diaporthe batatas TaxID=748121 RepID=UPI001D04916F|nr:uncharacterized protein KVR01_005376 [Diaporthe batatas]KAG8165101.1 hypothetical protein KVR01_005376 [Diaporthe batatas]
MEGTDRSSGHERDPSPPSRPLPYLPGPAVANYGASGSRSHVYEGGYGSLVGSMTIDGSRGAGGSPLMGMRPETGTTMELESTDMMQVYQQDLEQLRQQSSQHMPGVQQQQQAQPGFSATATGATAGPPKPIRRRMRMITSCLECRRRKLKCNKSNPCTNCLKFSRDCLYLGPKLDEASQLRLTEIKEKVGSLERQLERDVAKSGSRGFYQQRILADDVEGEFDEERGLEITPMVALDLTYEDDADGTDDVMDLGVQVGKMRLTEKIGGLNRPRISEEVSLSGGVQHPDSGSFPPNVPLPPGQPGTFSDSTGGEQSMPEFLRPGTSYIPPTSGVFFGKVVQSPSLLTFLPTKPAGDRLIQYYFESVHPIARCVHRPSFEVQYATFWEEAADGYEPRASAQAVVFSAWLSAAVALDETAINREFGLTKANLVENMKVGTEVALSKSNFLRTTRVETLQAFVMYMIPLCREEVSRAHSVLVGAAVRMAECMGLHRDGSRAYNLNALETHVRRLIWHQLCFLDIRTCEAQGPKPAIRREDYDTWLPDNCEEEQLSGLTRQLCVAGNWTTMLFPLIRFEVNEMMRIIWADRRKLEARKITLTQVLTKIENFRKRMFDSYNHLLDERVPIQRYAKLVMHLLMYRLHVMVLHPYYANTASPMPQRLRSVLITSAVTIIEIAIQLDTSPAFQLWRWYNGAYQQYQAALILATEMFYHPAHRDANRIWACLDYVFGLDQHLTNEEKGKQVLSEIMTKMGAYMSMRKMRAPTWTAAASPSQQPVREASADGGGSASDSTSAARSAARSAPAPAAMAPSAQQHSQRMAPGLGSAYNHSVPLSALRDEVNGDSSSIPPASMRCQQQQNFPAVRTGSQGPATPAPPQPQHQKDVNGPNPNMAGPWTHSSAPTQHLLDSESPENSSSETGSIATGSDPRPGNTAGMVASMVAGGGSMGATGHLENEWSTYQEEAINALFPFDPQTGSFAGFGDPITMGINSNSWAQQAQSQVQIQNDGRTSRGGYN